MSLDSIALRSYPKHPVTQSTRSSQARSLKPMMQTSQNLLPHTPYHCPALKYMNYKNLIRNFTCFAPQIEKGHLADSGYFIDKEDDLLWQRISDNSQEFEPVVLPNSLISTALLLAHDHTGHNGFRRTYAALKWLYYWKGMKKDVLMHCKHCQVCAKQKVKKTKFIKDNFRLGSMPMEFISMDLVSRLCRTSSGHEYALTVICMLTGNVFCIPLKTKTAEEIVDK